MMLLSQQLLGVLLITLAHGVLEVGADGSQTTPDVTSETITGSGTTVVTDGPQPTPEVTSEPLNITESRTKVVTDGPQPTPEVTSEPLNITESQLEVVTDGPQPTPEVTSEPLNITEYELEVVTGGPQPTPEVTSEPLNITEYDDCPFTFSPPKVVVKYGEPVSVNCFTNITYESLRWEGFETKEEMTKYGWSSLTLNETTDWEIQPSCAIIYDETQCLKNLSLTIYKTPDSVSISRVDNKMIEGFQYDLQCDIVNVAPVKNLTVKWFKGETEVQTETFNGTIKTPVNETSTLQITAVRDDDGAQYRCEAELELGAHGPQPPPKVTSELLNITVYKTLDSVSISTANWLMIEGSRYKLQCNIVNVAPVESLIVKWYKGETRLRTDTFNDTIKTPENKTATFMITANRDDDGAQYRCEAELNLGIDGPQSPPKVTSKPLNITVYSFCDFLLINPSSVVVEYGSSVSVNCSTDVTHDKIGWDAQVGSVSPTTDKLITWNVSNLRRWDIRPKCYIRTNLTKCVSLLPVLIYKTPDSVSINKVDYKMIEGIQYELQCNILNVAPVQNLTVKWFKAETEVKTETFTDTIKTPVKVRSKLRFTPVKSRDDGAQYRCEAEMNLGADGPQPPPKVTSDSLNITVYNICALLQLSTPSVVVEYGSSVSVDCSTDVTHDGIGWEATVGTVPLTKDKLITWKVSNLRQWEIKPQCYINYNRDQCSHFLPVTVYKTPDSVSINTVNHTGPMREGSQYELQCDIVNVAPRNLTVKWFKRKTEVKTETFNGTIKTPVNLRSTLNITAVRSDDGAQYRCEAELELGADGPQPPPKVTSEPLNITIHYVAQISVCRDWAPKTGTLLSSHPSSLYSIVGNPRPNISWKLESSSINDDNVLYKNDSGRYTITARNTYGESSCEINITVEYPPTLNCSKTFYEIKEKEPFKFPCSANGLPKSVVSVYKADGKVIQFPFTPHRDDSGLYNVTASNKHGHAYLHLNLSIQYAPVFDTSEEKFDADEGSNITLKCISSGNPEPNMWWTFKNQNITTGGRDNTINITKATSVDAGVYTCSATNQFGRKDKHFTVVIKEKSPSYFYVVYIILVILAILLMGLLFLWLWKKSKARGSYQVRAEHELIPLTNGKSK